MIELVVTLCLLGSPTACQERLVSPDVGDLMCMIAIRDLPETLKDDLPRYWIKNWKCRIGHRVPA